MKKMLMVCVAFALSIVTINNVNAQTKIGSFDEESILGLMPGIQKVDTLLRKYVADSLNPKRDYEMMELKRKDSTFRADSLKLSASLREIMQKEISQHYYIVANWQEISYSSSWVYVKTRGIPTYPTGIFTGDGNTNLAGDQNAHLPFSISTFSKYRYKNSYNRW